MKEGINIKENFSFEWNVAKEGKVLGGKIPTVSLLKSHVLRKINKNKEN